MRNKEYVGALRLHEGYPMLVALHFTDEVVAAEELEAPTGPELAKRELDMIAGRSRMSKDELIRAIRDAG